MNSRPGGAAGARAAAADAALDVATDAEIGPVGTATAFVLGVDPATPRALLPLARALAAINRVMVAIGMTLLTLQLAIHVVASVNRARTVAKVG